MSGTVYRGGGFNGVGLENASENLRARIAAADAVVDRETRRAEQERKVRAEQLEDSSVAASVWLAVSRGEAVTPYERTHGVGRTRAEAVSYFDAVQNMEDAREAAAQRRRMRDLEIAASAEMSGDTTAPTQGEIDARVLMESQAAKYRAAHPRDNAGVAYNWSQAERRARWDSER